MRAVDSNVLVYAHRTDSPFHWQAITLLRSLVEGKGSWAIAWPCVYEFYGVVTHPRLYSPPSSPAEALEQIQEWLDSPSVVLLAEPSRHWQMTLQGLLQTSQVRGPVVHDGKIAAICQAHGVTEFVTLDRDFSRFPGLVVKSLLD